VTAEPPPHAHLQGVDPDRFARARWARWVTIALGLWLAASTLLFPHASSAGFDTLMIGIFIAANGVQAASLVLVLSFVPSPPRLVHPRQAAVGYRP